MEIRNISCRRPRSVDDAELGNFTLLFCRGRQRNQCTKIYNARAQLLFSLLNLVFGDVLVSRRGLLKILNTAGVKVINYLRWAVFKCKPSLEVKLGIPCSRYNLCLDVHFKIHGILAIDILAVKNK